ncbi:MAG: hypothetical protein Q9209_000188 [Squamulea sp. 1 TL-2023]
MAKRRRLSSPASPSLKTTTSRPCESITDLASPDDFPPKPAYITITDIHLAYTQLGARDTLHTYTLSREDANDNEIDELAGTSLVNVPTQHTAATSSPRKLIPTEGTRSPEQTAAKPLPPLPSKPPPKGAKSGKTKIQALGPKSTNQKIIKKNNNNNIPAKPDISSPVLISSSTDPFVGTVATGRLAAPNLIDPEGKLTNLTQQADAQEAETRAKEKELLDAEAAFRPSSLQRGRSVLMTAKHAIARRLGSPNIKLGRFKTPLNRALTGSKGTAANEASMPVNVLPRPLPVYESMRSRRETPELQEVYDPFSDKMEMNEAWSDFDFNFSHHEHQSTVPQDDLSSLTPSMNVGDEPASENLVVQSKSIMSFSNKVSGLKQHPNPVFFSSSPVGFSTPRVQLEPTADANGKKRLSTVLVRDPSSNEINSERDTSDDEDDPLIHNETNAVYGSNMKRKSATEDLRSQLSKRAKTDSGASGGSAVLTQGFDQLGTNDGQVLQGIESTAEYITSVSNTPRGKGFGIFDMGKGTEPETRSRDSVEGWGVRRHSRQRSSSISRPTSVLFSRESRARVPLLDSYKEDQMDIDELQMDGAMGKI